jgi:hypothetical protein
VRIVRRGIVRQPVLHVHPGPRTAGRQIGVMGNIVFK